MTRQDVEQIASQNIPKSLENFVESLGVSGPVPWEILDPAENLLPQLASLYTGGSAEIPVLLQDSIDNGAVLNHGLPPQFRCDQRHRYWTWLPRSLPEDRVISVPCSRLGKKLFEMPVIADAIRTLVSMAEQGSSFATSPKTTLHDLLIAACSHFNQQAVVLQRFPNLVDKAWIKRTLASHDNLVPVYVNSDDGISDDMFDALLMSLSDEIRLIHARAGGNVFQSVAESLRERSDMRCFALRHPSLKDVRVKNKLRDLGAVDWWLYEPDPRQPTQQSKNFPATEVPLVHVSELPCEDFVSHWTRPLQKSAVHGTHRDHLQDFLFGRANDLHGALGTLERILLQSRLVASGKLIRNSTPVVCFTEVPLSEFPKRRKFRKHLARWDFECFGLAIRKDRLVELGGRPVTYGDKSKCPTLTLDEQPYFQVSDDCKTDWSAEREWRVVGDIDLRLLAADEAVLFVDNVQSAEQLSAISRWPIVYFQA